MASQDLDIKMATMTTEVVYPHIESKYDDGLKAHEAMSKVELQQLIINNQLYGTEHDNILKTQNLTAESIYLEYEYKYLKEENFRLKEVISKINKLDEKKAAAVETIAIKSFNEQKATLCKLIDRKYKLTRQLDLLNEQYNPNERIRIDDVPGMDRIRDLELNVENMKLKLNEASNINQNFKQMLYAMHEKNIKFDNKANSYKQLVIDATNEHQNSQETRKQAEEAAVIMEANYYYRVQYVYQDSYKRRMLLQQRKEQVRAEKEKTDYICSYYYVSEDFTAAEVSQLVDDGRYRGAAEYYREHISNQIKIVNPYYFAQACIGQGQKGDNQEALQKKLDEYIYDLQYLKVRIADSTYEYENNKNMQKKEVHNLSEALLEKKYVKMQGYNKYSEVRQKSVYLKTALSSILDKMGASKLVPEEQINLMLGDDVLIDSLSSNDRRVFDAFVNEPQTADIISQSSVGYQYQLMVLIILSKLRWMNEMWKEIDGSLEVQRVSTQEVGEVKIQKPSTEKADADENADITVYEEQQNTVMEDNFDDIVLDDDEEELKIVMEYEAQQVVKIELPTSRPSSARPPLGGTKGRVMEIDGPPQQLSVIDRYTMKAYNEQFAMNMSMNKAKDE